MVFGVICSCCGEKKLVEEGAEEPEELVFMCQPCTETDAAPPLDLSIHTIPADAPVVVLEATKAFDGLTPKERAYALALASADWAGAKICLIQTSPESAHIFALLQLIFSAQPVPALLTAAKGLGLTDDEISQAMIYAAAFYGNLGNYKSFGDTKFIPALPAHRFQLFLAASAAPAAKVDALWQAVSARMYSLPPRQRQLGLGESKGISTYFSSNCEPDDADICGRFLESKNLSPYNTRLFKGADGSYTVLLASALTTQAHDAPDDDVIGALCRKQSFEGHSFTIRRGDYSPLMQRIVDALSTALPHCDNADQTKMIEAYIESFSTGSIESHKEGSRHWIKDKGPAVESYIGTCLHAHAAQRRRCHLPSDLHPPLSLPSLQDLLSRTVTPPARAVNGRASSRASTAR